MRDVDPLAVEFTAAIVNGEVERLTNLLREHPDLATGMVEDHNGGMRSSLHLLADAPGHRPWAAQTAAVLVAAGADLEAQAAGMWHVERPLHWAASNDDVELIDALLDAGADIEAAGSSINGGSPLSSAVGYGQWNAARRLVARGARTDLWHAAALGLLPIVSRLVDGEPDLDGPLWNACRGGQLATAQFLVERGASPHWQAPWSGQTTLDVARTSGNDELIAWLTSTTDRTGQTDRRDRSPPLTATAATAGRKDDVVTQFPGGRINHINPVLNVRDLSVSVDFYTRILGLELYHTFGEPADFAIVGRDSQQIYLCQQAQGHPGTWLAVFISDPTAMFEHLTANGGRLVAPYDTDAGEFRVEDPDGHILRFFR